MKFAIRDDDISFFTVPSELEEVYNFVSTGKISLSIVPFTVAKHKEIIFPYGEDVPDGYYSIEKNQELLEYLNNNRNRYDFLLHGYTHEYKKIEETWVPELVWKDKEELYRDLKHGKDVLESNLHTSIKVLVAPNNMISAQGIEVAEELGLDFSGIIQLHDRKMEARYIYNFLKRWGYRIVKGIPYGGVLKYKRHNELVAYSLDDYDRLLYEYNECKKIGTSFVVYTHYWDMLRDEKKHILLKSVYEYVINDGAELVPLSSCFS